jgi:hypothetical protein
MQSPSKRSPATAVRAMVKSFSKRIGATVESSSLASKAETQLHARPEFSRCQAAIPDRSTILDNEEDRKKLAVEGTSAKSATVAVPRTAGKHSPCQIE